MKKAELKNTIEYKNRAIDELKALLEEQFEKRAGLVRAIQDRDKTIQELQARIQELKKADSDNAGAAVDRNSLKGWQPRFTIADRDAKIKGMEADLNALRAYLANESGEVFVYPEHKLMERDANIKGLQAELAEQRMHYQGELDKATKRVLELEHFVGMRNQELSGVKGELEIANAQLREIRLKTGYEGPTNVFKCACCNQWQPDGSVHRCGGSGGEE